MTPLQTSTGVLPGADWEVRPERRVLRADLGPASFRAPGVATWSGGVERRHPCRRGSGGIPAADQGG